ncbi:hypothetical protein L1D26_08735 [Vibrio mediterranei]|uniref:Bacteriocin n=1 Tax=Vibrio mediterranei TaxID=689 RepID=A0ABX5DFE1_9VIBR|nr:hypothetical protein [Vibrio mediterranei]MCG9663143.1 hypothetical protein [Vibrio mediterranei]PCD89464.1 hypothetical protein COR52_05960 [Vibrio mediterranei]PRQ68175.1 hypothetical protein COR51_06865 [Vibrio mediterranei]
MYNLSADEISMVDGGGDGNSSGYPASPGSNPKMSVGKGAATYGIAFGAALTGLACATSPTNPASFVGCIGGLGGIAAGAAGAGSM